jgi:hypothetical protein
MTYDNVTKRLRDKTIGTLVTMNMINKTNRLRAYPIT